MPVFLTPPQTCSLLTASRRGDVESLKSEVDILAETFGVIKGEILLSAEDNHGNTVLHASSELGLTSMRPKSFFSDLRPSKTNRNPGLDTSRGQFPLPTGPPLNLH